MKSPSAAIPASPSVELDAPESWHVHFAAPAGFSVIDVAAPEGAYRTNVVVTITRDALGVTLEDAETAIDAYVASRRGFALVANERVERDGVTWLRREYDVMGPSGAPDLRFMVAVTVVDRAVCVDQVRLTGTARHAAEGAVADLAATVDSARVALQ